MHILVTGGAGFIGSHLVEALTARGETVTVFDNLSTGRMEHIQGMVDTGSVRFVKGDILDVSALAPLIDTTDQIFHLAAAVGVRLVVDEPLQSLITNLEGTRNVLECARKKKTPVLIASTSEVYGKNTKVPFQENAERMYGSVYAVRWGYALGKAVDELLGLLYWRTHGLPTVMVRFFNTTGPRQSGRYGMVVPRFIDQALAGGPITVYGDGAQIRSFGHVKDIVRGIIALLETPSCYGEVFNLGAEEPITVSELALRVKEKTASNAEIKHISFEEAYGADFEESFIRIPDISKAKKYIGYAPRYTLDDIIADVIASKQL